MSATNAEQQYHPVAKILHWAVAGLIVTQYVLANLGERAAEAGNIVQRIALVANHKSVGITILVLALLRIGWRVFNAPPALPASMPGWQRAASALSHWSLYGLLIALPMTGWLMSSAAAFSVSYFSLFTLPDLVAPAEVLKDRLQMVHELLAKALFALALLHILAALKHHFIDKDNVLKRMSSLTGWILFGTLAIGVSVALAGDNKASPKEATQSAATTEAVEPAAAALWNIDYANSSIQFTGEQAGAPFNGEFKRWTAKLWFDAGTEPQGNFDVSIETGSADTNSGDRDSTLITEPWFHSDKYATARFLTSEMRSVDDGGFVATATLSIKGIATPVEFFFDVESSGTERRLSGSARLDRLALGVGTGDWEDTDTVGQYVDVKVQVVARAAPQN